MNSHHNIKRFRLYDDLGYYSSYDTRRQAMQAIKSLGLAIGSGIWKVIDSHDGSVSFVKTED